MPDMNWQAIWTWVQSNETVLAWTAGVSIIMFVLTLLAVPLIVIWLPPEYLVEEGEGVSGLPRILSWPFLLLKNIVGAWLVLAGLAMLVLPGQGLLTLAIGLSFMNFPGKRTLICRVLSQKRIFRAVNRLRDKVNKPHLKQSDTTESSCHG